MLNPDANDPYGQPPLPYQPYIGQTHPQYSQQQEFVSPSTTPWANASHGSRVAAPARSSQAKSTLPRLSKAEALAFVGKCKRWLIAGSIVAFGVLSGLVAGNAVGATSTQATPVSNPDTTSPSSPSSSGGFFQQQQGGFGFGNSNSGQPPVPGSHTS